MKKFFYMRNLIGFESIILTIIWLTKDHPHPLPEPLLLDFFFGKLRIEFQNQLNHVTSKHVKPVLIPLSANEASTFTQYT